MNKRESAIISAYTGVSFGGELFHAFHQYVEELFGHPVWTHQMTGKDFWDKLKELSRFDFEYLAINVED